MQDARERAGPQQRGDSSDDFASEERSAGACFGDQGGCRSQAAGSGATVKPEAGPAEGEGDGGALWSRPPRDALEPALSLLPPRCLTHAALSCRGWAAVAAHSLGGRRRAQARARWAAATQALPRLGRALAEVEADAGELKELSKLESPPAPLSQLFWALEALWPRCLGRLGRWGRGEDDVTEGQEQAVRGGGAGLDAEGGDPPAAGEQEDDAQSSAQLGPDLLPCKPEGGPWRLGDPVWRQRRWEAARALMASPDFPCPGLGAAFPMGPRTLARLRSRTGGAGGPGGLPGPLVPEEVAAHNATAGRAAEWLLGAQELSRAALELEAARAWDWPQRLIGRGSGEQAGAAAPGPAPTVVSSGPVGLPGRRSLGVARVLSEALMLGTCERQLVVAVPVSTNGLQAIAACAERELPLAPRLPPLPPGASGAGLMAAVEAWARALEAAAAEAAGAGALPLQGLLGAVAEIAAWLQPLCDQERRLPRYRDAVLREVQALGEWEQ